MLLKDTKINAMCANCRPKLQNLAG